MTTLWQAVVQKVARGKPANAAGNSSTTHGENSAIPAEPLRPAIGPDKAALFLDSAGTIVAAQPRCASFFGRQADELSGLNFRALLKRGFDQEVTNVLANGQQPGEVSFYVLALRNDGSEFPTQLAFKFLPDNPGFCWAVFVQAPNGNNSTTDQKIMKTQSESQSMLAPELAAATATSGTRPTVSAGVDNGHASGGGQWRLLQKEYATRIAQLEQDLEAQWKINQDLTQKLEAKEKSLDDFSKGMRRMKEQFSDPATALEKAEAGFNDLQGRFQSLETEAAGLRQERDQLQRNLLLSQKTGQQAQNQVAELTAQLERTSSELQKLRAGSRENDATQKKLAADLAKERDANKLSAQKAEDHNSARQRLEAENRNLTEAKVKAEADLAKEREAHKLSRQKAEELNTQLQKSQRAAEQAESRVRESASRCGDWEKKAADLKKTVDELTQNRAASQSAAAQSAQRIKELEQQLKRADTDLAANKTEIEKQNSARQRLEAENRNLADANTKAKSDLAKERDANKVSVQKAEELHAHLQKLQRATEQADARIRESEANCSDSERKAADLKKIVDELTRNRAADQSAAAHSAQRVKELEQQLKRADANLVANKTEIEKQNSARQHLEAENRSLAEANAKAKSDLAESVKNLAPLQKRATDLEQRMREGVSSLAKMTAELQSERAERERAEKCASSAAAHLQQLNEKLNRQLESERANRSQIAELEKTIHDRGDALARASAALRKETKERHMAEKQLRLVSEVGGRLESNLASLEEAKKTFEVSLNQKEERLQTAERALAKANSNLEKQSTERHRLEGLLAEAQRQLEKLSGESKVEISRLRAGLELGELQRKRLEGDLLRSREIATNAQQWQNGTLDNLRRELRQPVEDMRQAACRLLETQVTPEQKRVAETMLEKALFLQLTLSATAKADSAGHSPAGVPQAESRDKKNESI